MNRFVWQFRLEGDEFDIHGVAELFADGVKLIKDQEDRHYLVLELPFTSVEAQAAHDAAEELTAKLNGIAQMVYENHENVRVGAMACQDTPNRPMTQILFGVGGIRSRSRVGFLGRVVTSDKAPTEPVAEKLIGDRVLDAADKDEHFERALYLYGSLPHDWRGLYMVLEAAEDANGGEKGLVAKRWVPDGKIKDFKATANSYKAIRLLARHASVSKGVPQAKQTLDEAREMIRTILDQWAKELG